MNGERIPDQTQEAAFRQIGKEKAWKARATMGVIHTILELLGYIPEQMVFREPHGKRWTLRREGDTNGDDKRATGTVPKQRGRD